MNRWQTILAIDADPWAAQAYAANFPRVRVECDPVLAFVEDLRGMRPDVILGGPPCQPHSLAGKRKASADARDCGPDFVQAVQCGEPRMFLMENVAGLLSSEDGRYFQRLFAGLESAGPGYIVQHRVLDAVDFGVPQHRVRVWIWGIRRDVYDAGVRHCWPKPTHAWPPPEPCMFGAALLPGVTVRQALELDDWGNCWLHRKRGKGMTDRAGGRRDHPIDEPPPTINSAFALGGGGGLFLQTKDSDVQGKMQQVRCVDSESAGSGCDFKGVGQPASLSIVRPEDAAEPFDIRDFEPTGIDFPPELESPDRLIEKLTLQSHADAARSVDEPATTLRSGGAGHDGCVLKIRIIGGARTGGIGHDVANRDLTDEPAQTIGDLSHGHRNGEPQIQVKILDAQNESLHSLDEPIGTIQGNAMAKGGAEGLLAVTAWKRNGELWVRRLSPLECARLQSVPDDFVWPTGITKTAAYRIIGNGIACGMALRMSEALATADPRSVTVIDLFCGGGLGAVGWHGRARTYAPHIREAIA